MALSGTLNSTSYQGRYVQFSWTATQDIATNKSTITWTLKGAGEATNRWYNAGPFYVSVGGTEKTSSSRVALYEGTQVLSGTKTITHDSSGKATFAVTIKAAIYQQGYNCSGSKTFTLDSIPRKATITSAPNFTDESSPVLKYSNPAGNNVTILQAGIYKTDGTTALAGYRNISKTGKSYTFTFTDAEKTAFQKACVTANSMKVRYYVKTVIGSTTYTHSVEATLTIANGSITISPVAADVNAHTIALTGNVGTIVKYYSNIAFSFNEVNRKYVSHKSFKVVCGSKSSTSNVGDLNSVDSNVIKFTAVDTRGNSVSKTVTKTLVNYVRLTCSLSAKGELAEDNTATVSYTISGNYFNGSFGQVDNSLTLCIRFKAEDGEWSAWETFSGTITKSGNTYKATGTKSGLDYTKEYTFEAMAQDALWKEYGNWKYSAQVPISTKPVFDWGKNDFNFNVPVTLNNHKPLQALTDEGEAKNLVYLTANDNVQIGGGAYPPDSIYINTKDNAGPVSINGRQYGTNKVLWSGAYYMSTNQTATLNEAISAQPNGIILVFSRYSVSDSEALDQHWSYHFFPKIMLNYLNSGGSIFPLSTSNETFAANKYLYINDTSIGGHANNIATGTGATGVKYTNNAFVLRYVIGV